ncbi:MAG: DUF421 domain-containing protein [Chloroflexi bacterium AL-W]|nr:DUF421 domain-containing protein [Chloroflexi bacterium AL-N1]NOK67583.1 DUF421 domain-containing protein [Chloroflexi bacterium AL-N10]NOK75647.1 DUF421 domain-containing protein [Chloroflexi bacterium AL-N5]NOK82435.1 DUF421 domain-containing protein [Chloroflexi bacterium AL-W]NOK90280.1 DUF421 domain-containing protein [Chloroflexi bacterium AL-N15]
MFFNTWSDIGRVIVVGILAYICLILLLRFAGKRTLTKLNAFDLVITVALGSTLATILLSKDVALIEGIVAFIVLIALQFVVTWTSVRFRPIQHLVKSEPTLLFYRGHMLVSQLQDQRVTPEEVRAVIRAEGKSSIDKVEAVILETDGSFSVLPLAEETATTANKDVAHYPPDIALN